MMKVFFLVVLWFGLLRCVANRFVVPESQTVQYADETIEWLRCRLCCV